MATSPNLRISKESKALLLGYIQQILTKHKQFSDFRNKMEVIDTAYARYVETGDDEAGNTSCGNVFAEDNIIAPVVVSQVDSMTAYLADVFLSGYPIFPVVSTPAKRAMAEQLETLLDDHAALGGYMRQIHLFLKDGVKYNFSAIETEWTSMSQFSVANDYMEAGAEKLKRTDKKMTMLNRLDPYNTVWDYTLNPGDVARDGDYAGYVKILSRVKLKRLLNKLTKDEELLDSEKAMKMLTDSSPATAENFTKHPQVSSYVTSTKPKSFDWYNYISGSNEPSRVSGDSEVVVMYVRIIPSDFLLRVPQPNTPQIWRLQMLNNSLLIEARRIITAYDFLPILFGQPVEDGLGYQTQSVAESSVGIQDAASTLYNIRFSAARRAVSDRALYDASSVSEEDVNSQTAAPKIPVKLSTLKGQTLESVYKQIPFDMRGTETTISDAKQLVEFSRELSGLNNAQQGQFQKGNKSVQEWNDIMGASDNRLRLLALTLEAQVFIPMKHILMLNIWQYGEDTIAVSQKTGETLDIKMSALKREVLSFRLSDGYTPKSKMASTEVLANGMNLIMNSPLLQQKFGNSLPSLFAHIMQLGGVRGLEEYAPETQPQAGASAPPSNIPAPVGGQDAEVPTLPPATANS